MSSNSGKKKIQVVSGNGDELDISPVSRHIPISKPKTNQKTDKKIIIPKENKR